MKHLKKLKLNEGREEIGPRYSLWRTSKEEKIEFIKNNLDNISDETLIDNIYLAIEDGLRRM